jgi:hypothetical protein
LSWARGISGDSNAETRSSKPSKSKSVGHKQKRKPSQKKGNQKPRKGSNQKTKRPSSSKTEKKHEPSPSIKNKVKTKPSRKQKPFHKPKKDEDEEDFFQIENSDSHQHSDHHIHQHDHLEAHKHHHKHKESHDHAHDHSNDHEHNHKHTHNHVHNHIHKHNEAHEHSAEHSHTEKHHHKHLEYIDAGGWRRRNDEYSETMLKEEPVALIMENRGLREPKDNVKSYLKNIITFFKDAADPIANDNQENGTKEKKFDKYSRNDYDSNEEEIDRQVSQNSAPEEYMDYSLEHGVQFANEYDGDEYYEDQTGYDSTHKIVSLPISDLNTNDWIGLDKTGILSDSGKEDQKFDQKKGTPSFIINALTASKV